MRGPFLASARFDYLTRALLLRLHLNRHFGVLFSSSTKFKTLQRPCISVKIWFESTNTWGTADESGHANHEHSRRYRSKLAVHVRPNAKPAERTRRSNRRRNDGPTRASELDYRPFVLS